MTIGLPRALLYFKYSHLWETFFETLGLHVIVSAETNKEILTNGIRYSIDECCLPAKIYMGHVYSLIGKCDYILVPRIESFGKGEKVCVKFNAMYDIVKNTFRDIDLMDYNIDAVHGEKECKGFIQMGKRLGKSHYHSLRAYRTAKKVQDARQKEGIMAQKELLNAESALKILIVSHPYNVYDKMLGEVIIRQIKKLGGVPIFADVADGKESVENSKEISNSLYWTYSKELVGAIHLFRDRIDGIILLTAFPCGPDSLVNELILRRIKNPPVINIILDELQGEAGLQTRIESFMDIIQERKKWAKGNEKDHILPPYGKLPRSNHISTTFPFSKL